MVILGRHPRELATTPLETPVAEETQRAAPEAKAPEAWGVGGEAVPGCLPHPGAPEVVSPSSSPRAGRHVQRYSRLCVDFAELRKRRGSPSSNNIFGPLKGRKSIAVDV